MLTTNQIFFIANNYPESIPDLHEAISMLNGELQELQKLVVNDISKYMSNGQHDKAQKHYEFHNEIRSLIEQNTNISLAMQTNQVPYNIENYSYARGLLFDFSGDKPVAFKFLGKNYIAKTWKEVYQKTCELLDESNPELFKTLPDNVSLNGERSPYFTMNSSDVQNSSKMDNSAGQTHKRVKRATGAA